MILKKNNLIFKKNKKFVSSQSTFSKILEDNAYKKIPFALSKGKNAYVYDYDNNKYIDTIMSLGAVILGHSNSKVNQQVIKQIKKGSTLSLTTRLEGDLAEILVDTIPSAESVRFGKHGNDATTAAVRLARHYTNKDHILFCGYHGWQDWYISKTSMNGGIPNIISKYSHRFIYNDIESLNNLFEKFKNKVACVIMEPISKEEPICKKICSFCKPKKKCLGFLKQVKKLTHKNNALLIFDEVVTGFRISNGGYQKVCKVTPDLSCFSKAMGNGFPISALVGKKEFMKKSNEIFYSLTFGSDPISMAASIETIKILKNENVLSKINSNGNYFLKKFKSLINKNNLANIINITGFSYKNIILISDSEFYSAIYIRNYLLQLLAEAQILTLGFNIFSYSHNKKIMDELLNSYDEAMYKLNISLNKRNLKEKLLFSKPIKSAKDL